MAMGNCLPITSRTTFNTADRRGCSFYGFLPIAYSLEHSIMDNIGICVGNADQAAKKEMQKSG